MDVGTTAIRRGVVAVDGARREGDVAAGLNVGTTARTSAVAVDDARREFDGRATVDTPSSFLAWRFKMAVSAACCRFWYTRFPA